MINKDPGNSHIRQLTEADQQEDQKTNPNKAGKAMEVERGDKRLSPSRSRNLLETFAGEILVGRGRGTFARATRVGQGAWG